MVHDDEELVVFLLCHLCHLPFCDYILPYFIEKVKVFSKKSLNKPCIDGHAVGAVRRTKSMT
nr:hypothetical protein QQAWYXWE_QQAWYXWE_CDS_0012 [Microvirus sp.]